MNDPKYRWILYLISSVILVTLCIQVYWNYKNYEIGKQQLINDVQASIDQVVDNYYTELAKSSSFKLSIINIRPLEAIHTTADVNRPPSDFPREISIIRKHQLIPVTVAMCKLHRKLVSTDRMSDRQ